MLFAAQNEILYYVKGFAINLINKYLYYHMTATYELWVVPRYELLLGEAVN